MVDRVMIYVREVVGPYSFRFFYGAFGPLVRRHSVEGLQMKLKFFAISQREEFWLNRAIRYSLRQEEA